MAKDLRTIPLEIFELHIKNIKSDTLRRLLVALYEDCSLYGRKFIKDKIPDFICDLERKQTKILNELMRRGEVNKKNFVEYTKWLYKHWKKRFF